jgi:gamma-glutamylcyclotransferase (GGCT)/AIG2-like uncharacterized protein YtfP
LPLAFFYGTFMRGQPGEANLAAATFVGDAITAPRYRLYSIRDEHPLLVDVADGGASIDGQLLDVPQELWDGLLAVEPHGVHMSSIELADGQSVAGMLGTADYATSDGTDITAYGGWAAYVASR